MKKLFKWLAGLLLTVVVLVVLAAIALPLFFDPNDHKPRIEAALSEALGRPAELRGLIEWSVFPSIALGIHDVRIANAPGFGDAPLAQVNRLSADVRLWPLLSREIRVGAVALDEATIQLQVNAQGVSNWQSIVQHLQQSGAGSEASDSDSSVEIRQIDINNSSLNYSDRQAGQALQLRDLNLSLDGIGTGRDSTLEFSAQLSDEDAGLQATLAATLGLSDVLADAPVKIALRDVRIDGAAGVAKTPWQARINGGQLDLGSDALTVEALQLALANARVETSLKGERLSGDARFSGQLQVDEFALDEWLAALGVLLHNAADNRLSLQANWQMQGSGLKIQDLDARLDETRLNGQVNLTDLAQQRGSFVLNVDHINLDDYLPVDQSAAEQGDVNAAEALDFGHLKGTLSVDALHYQGLQLSHLDATVSTDGPRFAVQPLSADFYQGRLNTALSYDGTAQGEKLKLKHSMEAIQAGPLLTDLSGEKYLTGLGGLTLDLALDAPFSEQPMRSATGRLSYRLDDGEIYGVDVFGMVSKGLSLLYPEATAAKADETVTRFAAMQIDADIEAGVLKTRTLSLKSPYFEVNGAVQIDLADLSVSGHIRPMLIDVPEQLLAAEYQRLLNVRIPVSLAGPLLNPEVKIDVAELIKSSQQDKIDRKKDELKKDLLNKLLNKDDEKDTEKTPAQNDGAQSGQPAPAGSAAEGESAPAEEKQTSDKDRVKAALLQGLLKRRDDKKDQPAAQEDKDDGGQ